MGMLPLQLVACLTGDAVFTVATFAAAAAVVDTVNIAAIFPFTACGHCLPPQLSIIPLPDLACGNLPSNAKNQASASSIVWP